MHLTISLLLSIFLINPSILQAASCKALFKGTSKLQQHQAQYERSKNHYNKLALRNAEDLLFERVAEGRNAAVETIAYLDAKNNGELFSKLANVLELNTAYRAQWMRWLGYRNQLKQNKTSIEYNRNFYQQNNMTKDFVKDLLSAFYKVELRKSKDKLFRYRTTEALKSVENLDRFFYENEFVIQRFGRFELADHFSLNKESIASIIYRFFSFADPVMQHRLNQFDLKAYRQGNLSNSLRRLRWSIHMHSGQRKFTWAIILGATLMIPYNYTTVRTTVEIGKTTIEHNKENKSETKQRIKNNFSNILDLIQKRNYLEELIDKSTKPEEIQVYREELRLVVEQLDGRPQQQNDS